MALIVEDGTVVADAESYASVAYADSYHDKRGHAAWSEATTPAREQALRRATQYVDVHYRARFLGYREDDDQELEWPRLSVTDESGIILDQTIPVQLKHAVCELALRALDGDLLADEDRGGAVTRVKVGEIEQEYAESAPAGTTYRLVDELLGRLLRGGHRGVRIRRG